MSSDQPARFAPCGFSHMRGRPLDIAPQHGTAVVEIDHELTPRQRERVLADLQSIGLRAVILPVGVSLAHVAQCGLDDEDDE